MSATTSCVFLSFDYLDYDVFLNARVFYRLAGYYIHDSISLASCDLLVVFRGIPSRVYTEYSGPVHFYDYVLEHQIDLAYFFPNASSLTIISIQHTVDDFPFGRVIYGYLPVIPSVWQFSLPFTKRSPIPVHVSNYKPLQGDQFQQQLISQIKSSRIRVYGAKWNSIQIRARPLSYLEANLKLANAYFCYGLMYPYQRGKSLSGRMWQAPIQGCTVISEENTNIFLCPGVVEVSNFSDISHLSIERPHDLAMRAASFWLGKTNELAKDLNLTLNWNLLPKEVAFARILILFQHVEFIVNLVLVQKVFYFTARIKSTVSSTTKKILKFFS
jgi:hypothetical protein